MLKLIHPTVTLVNRTEENIGGAFATVWQFGIPYNFVGPFNPNATTGLQTPWGPGWNTAISDYFTANYTAADADINCQNLVHVISEQYKYLWTNTSNDDLEMTLYLCQAREDRPYYAGTAAESDDAYAAQAPANLWISGLADTSTTGGFNPSFADVTTTLFMSRQFCQAFKVLKVEKRKLRAGQTISRSLKKGYSKHYINELCVNPTGLTFNSPLSSFVQREIILARKGALFYVVKFNHYLGVTINTGSVSRNRIDVSHEVRVNCKFIKALSQRRVITSYGSASSVNGAQVVNPDLVLPYRVNTTSVVPAI